MTSTELEGCQKLLAHMETVDLAIETDHLQDRHLVISYKREQDRFLLPEELLFGDIVKNHNAQTREIIKKIKQYIHDHINE